MYAYSLCIKIAANFPSPCINHNFCRFACECYDHEANTVYEMEGKPDGKPLTSSLNICPETCCRQGWGQTGEGLTNTLSHSWSMGISWPRSILLLGVSFMVMPYLIPIDMQDKCQLQKLSKRGTGRVVVVLHILRGGVGLLDQLV
jgi:hypothetical protein